MKRPHRTGTNYINQAAEKLLTPRPSSSREDDPSGEDGQVPKGNRKTAWKDRT